MWLAYEVSDRKKLMPWLLMQSGFVTRRPLITLHLTRTTLIMLAHGVTWEKHALTFSQTRFSSLQNYFGIFTSLAALSGSAFLGLRQEQHPHASLLYCLYTEITFSFYPLFGWNSSHCFVFSQPVHVDVLSWTYWVKENDWSMLTCVQSSHHKWLVSEDLKCWGASDTTCMQAQSQRHHTIDHLEERGVERGSTWWERADISQTNTEAVSKATLAKLLRDWIDSIYGLSWGHRYHLELNSTELVCQYSAGTWSARHLWEARSCTHATATSIQAAPRERTIGLSGKTFSSTLARCNNPCMVHWAFCMQKYCGQSIKYWGCYKKQQQRHHRSCISVPGKEPNHGTGKSGLPTEKQWLYTLYNCMLCRDTASAVMSRHKLCLSKQSHKEAQS